jgi:PAS domain S-box-containing protein/putative nucleotidyltransferase with HDIG domain
MSLNLYKDKTIFIAVLMTIVIFIADIFSPLWYQTWVLYLIPLFFIYQSAKRPAVLSAIITVLVVARLFIFPSDSTPLLHAAANRITGIFGGWGVSFLLMRFKRLNISLLQARNDLEKRVQDRTAELYQTNVFLQKEIEERAKAGEVLIKSERRLRRAEEVANIGNWEIRMDGKIVYASDGAKSIYGIERSECKLSDVQEIPLPEYRVKLDRALTELIEEGRPYDVEFKIHRQTDNMIIDIHSLAEYDSANRIVFGIIQDITGRKKVEQHIETQMQRLSALRNIDMAITSSLDMRISIEIILNGVANQLHMDACDILFLNPHTQILEYIAGRGFNTDALRYTRLRLGESHAGVAALEKNTIRVKDLSEGKDGFTRSPLLSKEGFVEYFAVPLISKGHVKGVLEIFHRSAIEPDQEWMDFLEALGVQSAIAIDNAQMFNELERSNTDLALAYDTTLEGWSRALDYRDKETEGHSQRVTEMTVKMAQSIGIVDEDLVQVRRGALLHDIGKLGVPDGILLKPGTLTEEEMEIMKKHPIIAYEILSPISFLRKAIDIPYCHHEKWDGTGYPRGLKGEQIPLAARIFAVVDVFDALLSDRPYRAAWTKEKILEYIRKEAGIHFDPKVVEHFFSADWLIK